MKRAVTGESVNRPNSGTTVNTVGLNNFIILKGVFYPSSGQFPSEIGMKAGWTYIATDAGIIDNVQFNVDDRITALIEDPSSSTYLANWHITDNSNAVESVNGRRGAVSGLAEQSAVDATNLTNSGAFTSIASQIASLGQDDIDQQTEIDAHQTLLDNLGISTSSNASAISQNSQDIATLSQQEAYSQGKYLDDRAALLADTVLTYSAGQAGSVLVGDYIMTLEEMHTYAVVSSSETNFDVQTPNNVKLVAISEKAKPLILVLGGQSNASSSNAQAAGGDLTTDPKIRYLNGSSLVLFDPANSVGTGGTGRNSILFQAAKQAVRDGYVDVRCKTNGHAGDAISNWVGNGTSSSNYVSLKNVVEDLLTATPTASSIDAFIWAQGESDGGAGFTMAGYKSDFETLKSQLRAESWFAHDTPIACIEMPSLASAALVNRYFVSELPFDDDPYSCTVRTAGLDDGADNLHWTGESMNEIGSRSWNMLKKRVHSALPKPGRIDADAIHFRLEETFGVGLGLAYLDAPQQVVIGPTSDTQFPSQTNPTITFDVDGMFLRFDHYTYAFTTFEFLGGAVLKKYFGSNFANIGHAVNTDPNKKEGTLYMDSSNNYLVVSNGSGAGATWSYFSPDGTYTPS